MKYWNSVDELPEKEGGENGFNFKVTDYYYKLGLKSRAVRAQYYPSKEEELVLSNELQDPLGENRYKVTERLVHRYKDRVLLLTTDNCSMYCRHCFRRNYTRHNRGSVTAEELKPVLAYLKEHSEVHEILLSGGDPLTLPLKQLKMLLEKLRSVRKDLVIRIGTRVPVVDPELITDEMAEVLKQNRPVWIAAQFNHPDEITPEAEEAVIKLTSRGIPLVNQSVLLKGINSSVDTLKTLCHRLLEVGVKPYYLFQGDMAQGTSHFRVSIKEAMALIKELRKRVSGLALPVLAVDMPGGGGKIPLTENYFIEEKEDYLYFYNIEGDVCRYPLEE